VSLFWNFSGRITNLTHGNLSRLDLKKRLSLFYADRAEAALRGKKGVKIARHARRKMKNLGKPSVRTFAPSLLRKQNTLSNPEYALESLGVDSSFILYP
jgi:hypothetical protein